MACVSPIHGFRGELNEKGKRPVVFRAPAGSERQDVPCGKCVSCRLTYARNWAMRCMHEAQVSSRSCFVTLTFRPECLPPDGNLSVLDVQLFMKRLRKRYGNGIRYFFAGEYGGKFGRPHYHGLLFNHDFDDKVFVVERFENRVYESKALSELWPFGFHSVGDVTYASASYVARYCVKKVNSGLEYFRDEGTGKRYQVDGKTGETKVAEFTVMSRRPGIGGPWFDKFSGDVFPSDEVIVDGRAFKPPRFYDNLLDRSDPDLLESLKAERAKALVYDENTDDRLREKEEFMLSMLKSKKRPLEGQI